MPAKSLYLKDALASGSNHLSLQDGGAAPSTATISTGWAVTGAALAHFARMDSQTERAAGAFAQGLQPSGVPDNSLGDCFRTENKIKGGFAPGNWTLAIPLISTTAGGTQDVRVICRVWKGASATGSDAKLVSTSYLVGSAVANLTTTEQISTVTWPAPGFTLDDEYLFIQVALQIVDPTNQPSQNARLRVGSAAVITTTNYADFSLFLRMEGANGSTTFTDEMGHTFTTYGNAQLTTTAPMVGSSSGTFDGAGDYIDTPDSADFNVGSGDWTLRFWLKSTVAAIKYTYGQCDASVSGASIGLYGATLASGQFRVGAYVGGSAKFADSIVSVIDGAKHLIEATCSAGTMYIFVDRVLRSSVSLGGAVNDSANRFAIGRLGEYNADTWNGQLDEFQLLKGICLYTASYADDSLQADGLASVAATAVLADPLLYANGIASVQGSAALETAKPIAASGTAGVAGSAALTTGVALNAAGTVSVTGQGTLTDLILPTPVRHDRREYLAFFRAPAVSPTLILGTVDEYRGGQQHRLALAAFPSPQDNQTSDFGFQTGGNVTVEIVGHTLTSAGAALRYQTCELELVTRLYKPDGTTEELVHLRRMVAKRLRQRGNVLVVDLADLDRDELEAIYPSRRFTVEDWPNLFTDHVGRCIPEGVGTVIKVPLAWIDKTGGVWKYAGPRVIGSAGTLLAVYRGTEPGRGVVVDPSEYTASTATGSSSGVQVATVHFTREQIDGSGRPYDIEADYLLPGTRTAPAEISRILAEYGITVNATAFSAASAFDLAAGFLIDACYGAENRGKGRKGSAIIEDLLATARATLASNAANEWTIIQDTPRIPALTVDTAADAAEVTECGDGDVPAEVVVEGARRSEAEDDYALTLTRACGGTTPARRFAFPYVRAFTTLDRLASYWQARLSTLETAEASIHAVQLAPGALVEMRDPLHFTSRRWLIVDGATRAEDRNELALRAYAAGVYTYVPSAPPAGATNVYGPDYSFTPPAAPTGVSVVSQGAAVDNDGKVTAYALVRATPPAANWARLLASVTNTTTNEVTQADLVLTGGNYEVRVPGLRPNQAHTLVVQAINATGIFGVASATVNFTSANHTATPATPSAPSAAQDGNAGIRVTWAASALANYKEHVLERRVNAGSWSTLARVTGTAFHDQNTMQIGSTYDYRISQVDRSGNQSAVSGTASVTYAKWLDDYYTINQGISGGSIANSSINRARQTTNYSSFSIAVNAGTYANCLLEEFVYALDIRSGQRLKLCSHSAAKTWSENGRTAFGFYNDSITDDTANGEYRYLTT